jgi:hypothetical protein
MMSRKDVPEKYRKLYDRAMSGKSQAAAIRSHCLMCVGWQREEVNLCTGKTCPLYPFRTNGRKPRRFSPSQIRVEIKPKTATQTDEPILEAIP